MQRKNPKKIKIASISFLIAYLFLLSLSTFHIHKISISYSDRVNVGAFPKNNDAFLDKNFVCKVAQTFYNQWTFTFNESLLNIKPDSGTRVSVISFPDIFKPSDFNSDILRGPPLS
jgi:hypothetical protein